MAKTLQVRIDDDGTPHVVLDDVACNKLRAAIGVCVQVVMGETTQGPNAAEAARAADAMRNMLSQAEAPPR